MITRKMLMSGFGQKCSHLNSCPSGDKSPNLVTLLVILLVSALALDGVLDVALELVHDPGSLLQTTLSQLNPPFRIRIATEIRKYIVRLCSSREMEYIEQASSNTFYPFQNKHKIHWHLQIAKMLCP